MPTEKPRFTVTFPDELMQQIDEYRFSHRCRSQTQAIIELIDRGIDVLAAENTDGENEIQPADIGELSEEEERFIKGFAELTPSNRRILLGILSVLLQEQGQGPGSPG